MKEEMRLRPKGEYLHTATWEELYTLSDHWKSDMAFYGDEIRFFHKLIDKFFIWLTQDESIGKTQALASRLSDLNKRFEKISERINRHQADIGLLMENAFKESESEFRNEHVGLEEDLSAFAKEFRETKKEVFAISDKVIESEKLHHLLS
jgi:hypothetical protein